MDRGVSDEIPASKTAASLTDPLYQSQLDLQTYWVDSDPKVRLGLPAVLDHQEPPTALT